MRIHHLEIVYGVKDPAYPNKSIVDNGLIIWIGLIIKYNNLKFKVIPDKLV